MNNTIFYSWQSDLPNASNRGFIESCLKKACKKISKAKIFVADISIINSDYDGRKCPNPNVLLELGYASRFFGWGKIFCFYNLDYGSFDDLPFDLKQRRPITYSLEGKDKAEVREILSKTIAELTCPQ